MKGTPDRQDTICHTFNGEDLIEAGHPLQPIKRMVDKPPGADKGYDAGPFLMELEKRRIKPHVAIKSGTIDPTSERADEGVRTSWFVRRERRSRSTNGDGIWWRSASVDQDGGVVDALGSDVAQPAGEPANRTGGDVSPAHRLRVDRQHEGDRGGALPASHRRRLDPRRGCGWGLR